jgi:hypothetical protein
MLYWNVSGPAFVSVAVVLKETGVPSGCGVGREAVREVMVMVACSDDAQSATAMSNGVLARVIQYLQLS